MPGYESTSNIAFFAPAKTAQAIIDRLHQEIVKVIHRPDMKEMLLRGGVEPLGSTPKELGDYVEMDLNRITKMLAATGFKGRQP